VKEGEKLGVVRVLYAGEVGHYGLTETRSLALRVTSFI